MKKALEIAEKIAQNAGEELLNYFDLRGIKGDLKSDNSIITEADLAANKIILDEIRENFPEDQILSEEEIPASLDPKAPTWIIDPLDGTTNFSLGLQIWGVSIARVVDGYPEIGVLHFPLLNELYKTKKNEGAWLNGERIFTKPPIKDQPAAFFTCCTRTHRNYRVKIQYKTRILGAAAFDFCAVARGAAVLGFQATPKIWDIAAGWLLLEEAGGVAQVLHGPPPFPLTTQSPFNNQSYPTIMASNDALVKQAKNEIIPR